MLPRELVATLAEGRRRMPRQAWQDLANRLALTQGTPDLGSIHEATTGSSKPGRAWVPL